MKLVIISDTHDRHEQLGELPEGDILIHAGDHTGGGDSYCLNRAWSWLARQPHRYKILTGGNHDFGLEKCVSPELLNQMRDINMHYLEDSGAVIEGVSFWGSPWTPRFYDWAFMYGVPTKRWKEKVPDSVDVLITHGPPRGILDKPHGRQPSCGCVDLRNRVREVRPKVHCFGHIHGSYGKVEEGGTVFINASVVDERYQVVNRPVEVWV